MYLYRYTSISISILISRSRWGFAARAWAGGLIGQTVFIDEFWKVNPPQNHQLNILFGNRKQ